MEGTISTPQDPPFHYEPVPESWRTVRHWELPCPDSAWMLKTLPIEPVSIFLNSTILMGSSVRIFIWSVTVPFLILGPTGRQPAVLL